MQATYTGLLLLSVFAAQAQGGALGKLHRNNQGGSLNTTLESGAGLNGQYNIVFPAQSGTVLLNTNGLVNLRTAGSATELRFFNTAGTFFTGLRTGTPTANTTFVLPSADGAAGQLLSTNGSGQLQWVNAPTGNASGWSLAGNTGTSATTNFVGTIDNTGLVFRTNNTQRMIIDPAGNVGIGVNSPGATLSVQNSIEINRSPTATSALLFTNTSGSGDFRIGADGGDIFWQGGGGRNLQMGSFWTTIITGDRQQSGFPGFSGSNSLGTTNTGVLIPAQRTQSVALAVQGIASGTANMQEWRNSAGTAISVINNTGSLGLGTATPAERLDVSGNLRFSGALLPNGQAGIAGQVLQSNGANAAPSWVAAATSSNTWSISGNSSAGTAVLGTLDNNPLRFVVGSNTSAERMRITSAGNVGIGTTSPVAQASLHIGATANVPNPRVLVDRGGLLGGFTTTASDFVIGTNTNAIRFRTGITNGGDWATEGVERMHINNNGLVGINTGTTVLSSTLSVNGTGSNNNNSGVVRIANKAGAPWNSLVFPDDVSSTDASIYYAIGRGNNAGDRDLSFLIPDQSRYNNAGSQPNFNFSSFNASGVPLTLFTIEASTGNIRYRGNIATFSDARLKTNIQSLNPGILEKIRSMDGIRYQWNATAQEHFNQDTTATHLGVLAQQVEKNFPELIIPGEKGFKTVDYIGLIPVLLEGLKAQQVQIDDLKKEISNLKKNK